MDKELFLFHRPNKSRFCSGVFLSKTLAEEWISKYKLSGVLTKYPVNVGVYDWAIEEKIFYPKNGNPLSPDFISGFSSASQVHYHYEDGVLA